MDVGSVENPQDTGRLVMHQGETLTFLGEWYDGKTVIIFGRKPETQDPKYSHFEKEVGITLSGMSDILDSSMSRRALGMVLKTDGGIDLINLGSKILRWGQKESNMKTLGPGENVSLNSKEDDYRNLKIDIEPGYRIKAQSIGSGENRNTMGLRSVMFTLRN
jgi:hypothetical protein